jgi:hypothetical protein
MLSGGRPGPGLLLRWSLETRVTEPDPVGISDGRDLLKDQRLGRGARCALANLNP